MDEWGSGDLRDGASGGAEKTPAGRWDAVLTAAAFLSVTAFSFLAALLTKDIPSRPFWVLGLCFAAPVTALLLSVYLKEKKTAAMTPSSSRKSQVILICCSIAAAFVVGCFCQFSNEQTVIYEEEIVGEGWNDVLIILDKSGSMKYTLSEYKLMRGEMTLEQFFAEDRSGEGDMGDVAAEAVTELISQMDDSACVGLLIDAGWEENNDAPHIVPLEKRFLPVAPLHPGHRESLTALARSGMLVNENFPRALETVCDVVREYDGSGGCLSVVIVSDGIDGTCRFRAADYAGFLTDRKVKVHFLYVAPDYCQEMCLLAEMTGGISACIQDRHLLTEQMKTMVSYPIVYRIYKDALRFINESVTAKTVTGTLLLLLGLLVGFSLTVMLSLQGQKRFQMVLSPLMAVLAFVILAFGYRFIPVPWIREGVGFSLFGIVFMRRNREPGSRSARKEGAKPGQAENSAAGAAGDSW